MIKTTQQLKDSILEILELQKAQDVKVINLDAKSAIADYVIIVSGTSNRHVFSMKEKLHEHAKARGIKDIHIEGEEFGNWIIIDLGNIVIHLFRAEVREYYEFDNLWRKN